MIITIVLSLSYVLIKESSVLELRQRDRPI